MKRKIHIVFTLLTLLVSIMTLYSCNDEAVPTGPSLGVTAHTYTLGNTVGATTTLSIKTNAPVNQDVTVPIEFTGAQEGVDFTASASAFFLKAGTQEASLTLTRKLVEKSKTLLVKLKPADGVQLSIMNYSQVDLAGANVYSFEMAKEQLALRKEIYVNLRNDKNERMSFADTTRFKVLVDTSSTAVEGTHFRFVNNAPELVYAPKTDVGIITLEYLKLEEGKDKIVLRIAPTNGMSAGTNPTITISIVGPANFEGTWAYNTISNSSWLYDSMGSDASILVDGKPETDFFEMQRNGENYTFIPHFEGKLKNYFTAQGTAIDTGTRLEWYQEAGGAPPPRYNINLLSIEHINRNFSATDTKMITGMVGMRLITDSNTGAEILEMTIYDYEPTENTIYGPWGMTWKDAYEMMAYGDSQYPMQEMPIRIYFTRVNQ